MQIKVADWIKGQTCGLCGKADGEIRQEYRTSNGRVTRNAVSFAHSWVLPAESCRDTTGNMKHSAGKDRIWPEFKINPLKLEATSTRSAFHIFFCRMSHEGGVCAAGEENECPRSGVQMFLCWACAALPARLPPYQDHRRYRWLPLSGQRWAFNKICRSRRIRQFLILPWSLCMCRRRYSSGLLQLQRGYEGNNPSPSRLQLHTSVRITTITLSLRLKVLNVIFNKIASQNDFHAVESSFFMNFHMTVSRLFIRPRGPGHRQTRLIIKKQGTNIKIRQNSLKNILHIFWKRKHHTRAINGNSNTYSRSGTGIRWHLIFQVTFQVQLFHCLSDSLGRYIWKLDIQIWPVVYWHLHF